MTDPAPTAEQAAEWVALADAATPGPWRWTPNTPSRWAHVDCRLGAGGQQVRGRAAVADVVVDADARFIAAARTAVPVLAAALESARADNDRVALARRALLATGYFTEAQVGPDIAPRITEYVEATDALLAETVEQRDAAEAERDAERAKVHAVEALRKAWARQVRDDWGQLPRCVEHMTNALSGALAAAQPTGGQPASADDIAGFTAEVDRRGRESFQVGSEPTR